MRKKSILLNLLGPDGEGQSIADDGSLVEVFSFDETGSFFFFVEASDEDDVGLDFHFFRGSKHDFSVVKSDNIVDGFV